MLSIGTIYPNLKSLIEFDDVIELERNHKNLNSKIELINVNNSELFIKILNKEDFDYGIILTDNTGKNKIYFLNNISILSKEENNIQINSFFLGTTKGIFKIWKEYFENGLTEYNQWKKVKQCEKQAWLELALSFQNINYENLKSTIEIDGVDIKSLNDFFCSIGEALNGKGGYFGRDLYGFYDCLRSPEFGTQNLKTVIWKNHKKSKWKLKNNFSRILKTFNEFNIDVQLR